MLGQFLYIELSVFTSIIALSLSFFFYQARVGLADSMVAEIIKSLGLSLLILNLPLQRFKGNLGDRVDPKAGVTPARFSLELI